MLAIGHSENPESLYDNPQLYPQMFPWLFPYGLGGVGNSRGFSKMSDIRHNKWLLMYYDKHFQLDPVFPLIAWNHQQIKKSVTGGYLLAQKKNFDQVCERLHNLNNDVLDSLIKHLQDKGFVKPETEEEKQCYRLLNDLDFVNSKVDGSTTNRKYMCNKIWSMISSLGAPTWFITMSPSDTNHPIALYFADTRQEYFPLQREYNE